MSCQTAAKEIADRLASVTGVQFAAVGVLPPDQQDIEAERVRSYCVWMALKAVRWQRFRPDTVVCPACGAERAAGGEQGCPVCLGSGRVSIAGTQVSPDRLSDHLSCLAATGEMPPEGYLWPAVAFPQLDLLTRPAIRIAICEEIHRYPHRALLGRAPQVLDSAGLAGLVESAKARASFATWLTSHREDRGG